MPANKEHDWINSNWLSVQDFVTKNGFRILATGEATLQSYSATNDPDILSQNLLIERVDFARREVEPIRPGAGLYR